MKYVWKKNLLHRKKNDLKWALQNMLIYYIIVETELYIRKNSIKVDLRHVAWTLKESSSGARIPHCADVMIRDFVLSVLGLEATKAATAWVRRWHRNWERDRRLLNWGQWHADSF
jgi:hypothetical protein